MTLWNGLDFDSVISFVVAVMN